MSRYIITIVVESNDPDDQECTELIAAQDAIADLRGVTQVLIERRDTRVVPRPFGYTITDAEGAPYSQIRWTQAEAERWAATFRGEVIPLYTAPPYLM